MPLVSIIIPVYNVEKYLRQCLDSVVKQTLKDIEIICVNDCSPDNSLSILQEYAKEDNRIKIIDLKEKNGPGLARNKALDIATGEYIMFCDSDDWLELTACEDACNQIRKNDDDVVLFDSYEYHEAKHERKDTNSKLKFFYMGFKTGESFHFWDIDKPFINGAEAWYKIYKKSLLDKNKIRFPEEKFGEDVFFYFSVITKANTVSILNKPLYNYRKTTTSSVTTSAITCWYDTFSSRQKAYNAIINSEHKDELLKIFLPYYVNSLIHWYNRWGKLKGFPKKEYYDEMHKVFQKLKEDHLEQIKNLGSYIDYKEFKHIAKENWYTQYMKKIFRRIYSVRKTQSHKIITILGIKVKTKYKKQQYFYQKVLKQYAQKISRIKKKIAQGKKIRVAFYVNDTRWKAQNLFDLMTKSERYEPFILVGRHSTGSHKFEYQSAEELKKIYDYYQNKNMPVYMAYDFAHKRHISLKKFNVDILFYSRPWGIASAHRPEKLSKYALTCYIPYFISNSPANVEANQRFHNMLWKYFVLNDDLKQEYQMCMFNKGENLVSVGYPLLEGYLNYTPKENRQGYIIYAPHWSLGNNFLAYSTFDWNGKYILDFAKAHPEYKWVFKPHPILKGRLTELNMMTPKETDDYWAEWAKIAIEYEGPDYLDLFKESKCLITDCGSFLAEYMPTQNPVILLRSR